MRSMSCSAEPNSFDENEIQLLQETVGNISFVLENLEKDNLRKQAEAQIQAEKVLSDSIINSLPGIFYFYDIKGKFLRWNKNFGVLTGYSGKELQKMHPLDFFRGAERDLLKKKIANVFMSGHDEVIASFWTKDSRAIPYYFNGRKVTFQGTDYLIGMGLDITDRVKVENALLERTEEIEKLSVHLQNIREEEGSRIALEIHDVLGQQLTALKMDATWIKKKIAIDDIALHERISRMILLIDDTIKTIRRISSQLRPGILDDFGLVPALEWQGTEFERNTGIKLSFTTNISNIDLQRDLTTHVFRIFQETLTNITRHAHATEVTASFVQEKDRIMLVIRDNGLGFDLNEIKSKKSIGLLSMKERARILNGEVVIGRNVPHGTVVTLLVPLIVKMPGL
jgi:PAS domain S-box-containing protein